MKNLSMAEIKLSETEINAAIRVLRSGALRQGKECAAFEKEFCEKTGSKFALTNANGSAALHLAYMTILQPGDEVLVPSFTFIATGSMVSFAGGKPVFCDVDPKTFLIDLIDAEKRISPKTRAIAPVHLFGNPCDIEGIKVFAKKHNLYIVWDAAQAHGARYKSADIGSVGDFTCYSFYPSKNMFVGEGGMVCTDNPAYERKIRFMRSHGQTGKYLHTMPGLNYRMTDVEAAIGREQLKRLDEMVSVRRRNAAILDAGIADIQGLIPQKCTPFSEHAYHQYCIIVDPDVFGCDRDTLGVKLLEKGISTGIHYPRGLHQQPVNIEQYGKIRLPVVEMLAEKILAIPIHHGLSKEDLYYIVEVIHTIHRAC